MLRPEEGKIIVMTFIVMVHLFVFATLTVCACWSRRNYRKNNRSQVNADQDVESSGHNESEQQYSREVEETNVDEPIEKKDSVENMKMKTLAFSEGIRIVSKG